MTLDVLRRDAAALQDDLVGLRRALHRVPEMGLNLPKTQRLVLDAIADLGLEVRTGTALSSVVAVLRGGKPGPTVLLRGDMDALPVLEATGLPFASEHEGFMHACGHDLHTAMLVGAARLLAARRDQLAGTVVFMFQPGEEGFDGARYMIEEGVLEAAGAPADAAYAIHVKSAGIPLGSFATRPGTYMAAADEIAVTVRGSGGHGSAPQNALDPVTVMAEMITALQTMVTRRFSVFDPVVVTTGLVRAGTKANIIPDTASFESTLRTFSPASRAFVETYATRLVNGIAESYGLTADIEYKPGYPVTVNDAEHAALVADTAREVFGADRFIAAPSPMAGAEDFSRVLERVPGAFLFLGATPADGNTGDNHSPLAVFDDSILSDGSLMHAVLALRHIGGTEVSS